MTPEQLEEALEVVGEFEEIEKMRAGVAACEFSIDVDGCIVEDSLPDDAYRRIAAAIEAELYQVAAGLHGKLVALGVDMGGHALAPPRSVDASR